MSRSVHEMSEWKCLLCGEMIHRGEPTLLLWNVTVHRVCFERETGLTPPESSAGNTVA